MKRILSYFLTLVLFLTFLAMPSSSVKALPPNESTITKESLSRLTMGPGGDRFDSDTGVYIHITTGAILNTDYPKNFTTSTVGGRTLYQRKGYKPFDPKKYRDVLAKKDYTITVTNTIATTEGWTIYFGVKGSGGVISTGSVSGSFAISYDKKTNKVYLGLIGSGGAGTVIGEKFSGKFVLGYMNANDTAINGATMGMSASYLPLTASVAFDSAGNRTAELNIGIGTDVGMSYDTTYTHKIAGIKLP